MTPLSRPAATIRCLARDGRPGAIVAAEQTVDVYLAAFPRARDRNAALDAVLSDLARLRAGEPALAGFLAEVEGYIDESHRDGRRTAA